MAEPILKVDAVTKCFGGLTAVDTAVAPGTDLVTVSLAVGGVSFSATLGITISPAPQVLTSIAIAPTVV